MKKTSTLFSTVMILVTAGLLLWGLTAIGPQLSLTLNTATAGPQSPGDLVRTAPESSIQLEAEADPVAVSSEAVAIVNEDLSAVPGFSVECRQQQDYLQATEVEQVIEQIMRGSFVASLGCFPDANSKSIKSCQDLAIFPESSDLLVTCAGYLFESRARMIQAQDEGDFADTYDSMEFRLLSSKVIGAFLEQTKTEAQKTELLKMTTALVRRRTESLDAIKVHIVAMESTPFEFKPEALPFVNRGLQLKPDDPDLNIMQAAADGFTPPAIEKLQAYLRNYPGIDKESAAQVHYYLGLQQWKAKDFLAAVASLQRAVDLDPIPQGYRTTLTAAKDPATAKDVLPPFSWSFRFNPEGF